MKKVIEQNGFEWTNIENPTNDEIIQCVEKYKINPQNAERMIVPSDGSHIHFADGMIFISLQFPSPHNQYAYQNSGEIDFILGNGFLVTIHYSPSDVLYQFQNKFETESLKDDNKTINSVMIFFKIIDFIYDKIRADLHFMGNRIYSIEESIFRGDDDKLLVSKIPAARREMLDAKQLLRTHEEIWKKFYEEGKAFFGIDFTDSIAAALHGYRKIFRTIEAYREMLEELYDSHRTLLATKTNNVMKTISIVAFLTFPLTMLAQVFGSPLILGIIDQEESFFYFLSTSLIITALIFLYFRTRGWLD